MAELKKEEFTFPDEEAKKPAIQEDDGGVDVEIEVSNKKQPESKSEKDDD